MIFAGIVGILVLFVVTELLIVKFNGKPVAVPQNIPRHQTIGSGKPVTFVVFGDSTSVAQGGDYSQGIAVHSAEFLANKNYQVQLHNFGVSGARMKDVFTKQLPQMTQKPDVVLLSISANDVTHLTGIDSIRYDMERVVDSLRRKNPQVQIYITGTPAMGSIPRFPQPLRWLAGKRTEQQNSMFTALAADKRIVNIEIAKHLGPVFTKNPDLFAADKFHPNTKGYAEWNKVITRTLDTTIELP